MPKTKPQNEIFKQNISYIWYNQLYPNIKPLLMKPGEYQKWEPLTDRLLKQIPKPNSPELWKSLNENQRQSRMMAFLKVFKRMEFYNWSNQPAPFSCYGWKIIPEKQYEEKLQNKIKPSQSATNDFFKKGNIWVHHDDTNIEPFYIPSGQYAESEETYLKNCQNKLHPGLLEVSAILSKRFDPTMVIDTKTHRNLYKGFQKLFLKKIPYYHGYRIEANQQPSEFEALARDIYNISDQERLDFSNRSIASIVNILTKIHQKYFPHLSTVWESFAKNNFSMSDQITPLPLSIKRSEIEHFPVSRDSAYHYFKTSPSIYHKTCYYFLLNPIADIGSKEITFAALENHHIIPRHLAEVNQIIKPGIHQSFNQIRIPWLLHYLLHYLRYLEFQNQNDYQAVKVMMRSWSNKQNKQIKNNNNLIFNSFSILQNTIKKQSAQEKLSQDYGSQQRIRKQQKSEIIALYEQDMVWKTTRYPDMPEIFVPAKECMFHTQLVAFIKGKMKIFFEENPAIQKPDNWNTISDRELAGYLSKYLCHRGKPNQSRYSKTFWDFRLVEPVN